MRHAFRAGGLALIVTLAVTIVWLRPGAEPRALAAQPAIDGDLALVPADAVGFVHVRATELWKNDIFAGFRQTFERAGPKALAALDAQFVPKISTFERLTAFLMLEERQRPMPYVVLRFTAPFNQADVVSAYIPDAEKTNHNGKSVYHGDFDLYFPDNQHMVVSPPHAMVHYLNHPATRSGPLSSGLKLAASGKLVVASLNVAALHIPRNGLKGLPPEAIALLNAEHVTLSLDLAQTLRVDLVASYKSAAQAEAAEKGVKALAEFGRKELAELKTDLEKKLYEPPTKGPRPLEMLPETVFIVFALGAIDRADELLANPGAIVKRSGSELTAQVTLPKELIAGASGVAAVSAALLLPAVAKVRMSAARMQSQNNLKQIALAIHNFHDANGYMPHDITDKDGKPILSWRVAILPYIEQDNLYKRFKLDEPWDSENNKPLSDLAIKVFMSPQAAPRPEPFNLTYYQGLVGPDTAFEPGKVLKLPASFPDGTSNTILVVEAGEPTPWAKPGGIPYDPKKPLPKLALPGVADTINVALVDGSVRMLNIKKISEKTLRHAIERSDGQTLGDDFE